LKGHEKGIHARRDALVILILGLVTSIVAVNLTAKAPPAKIHATRGCPSASTTSGGVDPKQWPAGG
jgi:hypothetical protein